jgi:HK97 family phage prohead protease
MNKTVRKTYDTKTKALKDRSLVVRITTKNPDRSKDVVQPKGVSLTNYKRNPVVALNHNYQGLPIAKTTDIKVTDDGIMASVKFPKKGVHKLADTVYELYKDNFMNAWSIGFIPEEWKDRKDGGREFTKWELLEYSAVLVPDNPEALTLVRSKGFDIDKKGHIISKAVIPYKKYPLAPVGEDWNGSGQVASAEVDDLKLMATWFDSDKPDLKQSYKLPHHKADNKHTVWRGVASAMGALLGARGGVVIPDGDRKGVYNHLAKHYKEFDKEAPEFRNYTVAERKALIGKGVIMLPEKDVKKKAVKVNKSKVVVKYALDADVRADIKATLVALKKMHDKFAKLLEAQPKEPENETKKVIDLVEELKLADKTIGIALRNYKQKRG